MTIAAGTIALNINYEGFWLMILLIMMQNVASSEKKNIHNSRGQECKKYTLFMTKMAKIDTLFITIASKTLTHWGRTFLYNPYKGKPTPPPPRGQYSNELIEAPADKMKFRLVESYGSGLETLIEYVPVC